MDNIIICLLNGEKLEGKVNREKGNEEIDTMLYERGFSRDDVRSIDIVGDVNG